MRNRNRQAIGPYEDLLTTVKKTQTEMVWTHNKINRTCTKDPTAHCTKTEKERQTEKETGRQHNGMDMFKVG